jgi:YhcH/YjgK/YiaL family protein
MILDTLSNARRYHALHPAFAQAFAVLEGDLTTLAPGRHTIDGDRLYVLIDHVDGRGRAGARPEAHREHIDIQVALDGQEQIGWISRADCRQPDGEFDARRDIEFFRDAPVAWFPLRRQQFAIFFPDDVHAPLAGTGPVKKAIVKIAILKVT